MSPSDRTAERTRVQGRPPRMSPGPGRSRVSTRFSWGATYFFTPVSTYCRRLERRLNGVRPTPCPKASSQSKLAVPQRFERFPTLPPATDGRSKSRTRPPVFSLVTLGFSDFPCASGFHLAVGHRTVRIRCDTCVQHSIDLPRVPEPVRSLHYGRPPPQNCFLVSRWPLVAAASKKAVRRQLTLRSSPSPSDAAIAGPPSRAGGQEKGRRTASVATPQANFSWSNLCSESRPTYIDPAIETRRKAQKGCPSTFRQKLGRKLVTVSRHPAHILDEIS